MTDPERKEEWLSYLIQTSREVWGHGEGTVSLKVFKENNVKQWKIDFTLVSRGEEIPKNNP